MFNINDYVVYKRDLCRVVDIKEKFMFDKDYYVLKTVDDDSLTIKVPTNSSDLRSVITKKEALDLIKKMPSIDIIKSPDRLIENEYKELFHTDNLEDLIRIIKTTYLRNENRILQGKKVGDKDNNYFLKAEKYLYNELAVSLDMSFDECKNFIINEVNNM